MHNTHFKWDHFCGCCEGNEFVWHGNRRAWMLSSYTQKSEPTSSSLSLSGMMTGSDLWLPAIKLGLAIGFCLLSVMYLGFTILEASAFGAKNNIESRQSLANNQR